MIVMFSPTFIGHGAFRGGVLSRAKGVSAARSKRMLMCRGQRSKLSAVASGMRHSKAKNRIFANQEANEAVVFC